MGKLFLIIAKNLDYFYAFSNMQLFSLQNNISTFHHFFINVATQMCPEESDVKSKHWLSFC